MYPTLQPKVSVILYPYEKGIVMNFDFASLSKAAEKFKADMVSMREKAEKTIVTGESGAGLVKVTMNGSFYILSVEIDDSLINKEDKSTLQDLIVAATHIAREKAEKTLQEQMSHLTGGLGSIPGFPF